MVGGMDWSRGNRLQEEDDAKSKGKSEKDFIV